MMQFYIVKERLDQYMKDAGLDAATLKFLCSESFRQPELLEKGGPTRNHFLIGQLTRALRVSSRAFALEKDEPEIDDQEIDVSHDREYLEHLFSLPLDDDVTHFKAYY